VLRQELELEKAKLKLEEEKQFEIKPVQIDKIEDLKVEIDEVPKTRKI